MKLKYYLRGCGVGILITVIILMIVFNTKGGVMTDDKVMKRAAELGMMMPENTEENIRNDTQTDTQKNTQKPSETVAETEAKSGTVKKTDQKNTGKKEEKDTQKDFLKKEKKDKEKKSSKTKKEDKSTDDSTVSIVVKKGEVCRGIAEDLYNNGIIDDQKAFLKYMGDNGYDAKICVGTYQIKKNMTYKQIAEILTTSK